MLKKIFSFLFKVALSIFVFFLFLQTVPFFKHVSGVYSGSSLLDLGKRGAVLGETSIKLDIVDTSAGREKGLSGRSFLEDNQGLLFVFDKDGKNGIWMKDMNFSIDIIWLSAHKEVVHIEKNISPQTYPKVFGGDVVSRFVLEMPAHFVDRNKIKNGDLLTVF